MFFIMLFTELKLLVIATSRYVIRGVLATGEPFPKFIWILWRASTIQGAGFPRASTSSRKCKLCTLNPRFAARTREAFAINRRARHRGCDQSSRHRNGDYVLV
jgi:hypothetical protein